MRKCLTTTAQPLQFRFRCIEPDRALTHQRLRYPDDSVASCAGDQSRCLIVRPLLEPGDTVPMDAPSHNPLFGKL